MQSNPVGGGGGLVGVSRGQVGVHTIEVEVEKGRRMHRETEERMMSTPCQEEMSLRLCGKAN